MQRENQESLKLKKAKSRVSQKQKEIGEMKIFLDTADVKQIEVLLDTGMIDGVTTNPSLIAKSGGDIKETIAAICDIVDGPVSAEVTATDVKGMLGKSMGAKEKKRKMSVKESHEILINDESDKLIEQDKIIKAAKLSTENNGIVFLDEIDKISARTDRVGGDVSREGVQRDLLPLIEGTTVNTKHGPIKTDHILFIASGAFQLAKPSDLLPELQGRLPIRVELEALTSEDFKRILREPDFSLIKQYVALLKTENVDLEFSEDGIDTIANIASEVNATVENIGARRLHTIIERILDEISFTATDRSGEKIIINKV